MNEPIATVGAPAALGPYSQAVRVTDAKNIVFCSGQVGLDPATKTMVEGGVEAQTEQVLKNLGAVLEAAGMSFADIVRTTIYLTDLGNFKTVNAIYAKRFDAAPPARATVEVSALPAGATVEIDAIAAR